MDEREEVFNRKMKNILGEREFFLEFNIKNVVNRWFISGFIFVKEISAILECIEDFMCYDGDDDIYEYKINLDNEGLEILFYCD